MSSMQVRVGEQKGFKIGGLKRAYYPYHHVSNIASTQMNTNYNSQESDDYDPKLSYLNGKSKEESNESNNESLIFNNRNRERYSILEQME